MKKSRFFLLSFLLILLALSLSACTGNTGVASSWPGFSVDPASETVYLASGPHIYAVNSSNGTERWRFPAEANNQISFFAPPVLTPGEQLLAGGYNNTLYSLNPATGQETGGSWPFVASNRFIDSPLTTEAGIYAPSADNNLYALNSDGTRQWQFIAEEALWSTPAHNAETIYLSSMDHRVYALNGGDGSVIWKTEELGGAVVGTPAPGPDGALYVGTFNREIVKLDAANGSIMKRYPTEGWIWASPLIANERVYVGDLNGFFYALDLDLNEVWKINPDTAAERGISDQPLIVENTVYFSSESGSLFAVDAETGAPQWNKPIGGKLYSSPVLVNEDTILIAPLGGDSPLMALDLSGNQKWAFIPAK